MKYRLGKPLKRIGSTPCKTCPKKNPQEARHYELSDKNRRAVDFYYETRAMFGTNLTPRMARDSILRRNMGLIDKIVRDYESKTGTQARIVQAVTEPT